MSIRCGENIKKCKELIERIDTEIQLRQPRLYSGHNDRDILRLNRAELMLYIPERKKKVTETLNV